MEEKYFVENQNPILGPKPDGSNKSNQDPRQDSFDIVEQANYYSMMPKIEFADTI